MVLVLTSSFRWLIVLSIYVFKYIIININTILSNYIISKRYYHIPRGFSFEICLKSWAWAHRGVREVEG